jgi:putative proteasome-type protease
MTYCLAIQSKDGFVLASDSRTHAGIDQASVYGKMHRFDAGSDRILVLLAAGSLATTQALIHRVEQAIAHHEAACSLTRVTTVFDAAHVIGQMSVEIQSQHWEALQRSGFSPEATFILAGQILGQDPEIFLIYPQGNCIKAPPDTPFLQIGESKYGKPILNRVVHPEISLEDAARCALVSLDSTMCSNLTVGPPIDLMLYRRDRFLPDRELRLDFQSPYYAQIQSAWALGLRSAFDGLPRFDWEV